VIHLTRSLQMLLEQIRELQSEIADALEAHPADIAASHRMAASATAPTAARRAAENPRSIVHRLPA